MISEVDVRSHFAPRFYHSNLPASTTADDEWRGMTLIIHLNISNEFCRHATDHRPRRHVGRDHRAGRNHRIIADGDPLKDGDIRAYPDVFADNNGRNIIPMSFFPAQAMVDGGHHHIMANQSSVTDGDTALILKLAACVDKHRLANVNILAKIGVERGNRVKLSSTG